MNRRFVALLVLLIFACGALGIGIGLYRAESPRAFRFEPPDYGSPLQPDSYIDVIGVGRLSNGEVRAEVLAERLLVVDVRAEEIVDGRPSEDVTLQISSGEAELLQRAQRQGIVLQYSLRRPAEPIVERIREYISGPPQINVEDLKAGVADDIPPD